MPEGWLTISEVIARLRAAGYADGQYKVRHAIDRGAYGKRGEDYWVDKDTGYRYVKPEAVDRVIAERRGEA